MAILMNIPNEHGITVESGVASQGGGFVVVAKRWSRDETAQIESRWVRMDTEAEADAEADRIRGFDWVGILHWHESK